LSTRCATLGLITLLARVTAGVALADAEIAHTPALDALVTAAKKEGVLNVQWGGSSLGEADGAKAIEDALSRTFDAHFKVTFTPGPSMIQMAARIIEEAKAAQPASSDAFLGVDVTFPELAGAHVLQTVPWSSYFPSITDAMQSDEHEAVLAYTLFNGFAYDTQLVPKDEVPHKLDELFRPEWKGKLAPTPYASAFDKLALSYGNAKIRPIVEKIAQWAGGLIRCGEYDRIASGEFIGLALDCGAVDEPYMVENGGPVAFQPRDDALATELTYFAIPTKSAHPNLATLFAAYVETPEGQAIIAKYGATSHLVPGTPAYRQAKAFEARGLHLLIYTPGTLAPRMKELETVKKEYEGILERK
jgi:ABC-type Fe3+ transport system substrate-binding protein